VQGAGEATAVRLGDAVDGVGGGGVEPAVPDLHDGSMVAVLGSDRPRGIPGSGAIVAVRLYWILHHSEVTPEVSEHKFYYQTLA
jgi:hypothetical protein